MQTLSFSEGLLETKLGLTNAYVSPVSEVQYLYWKEWRLQSHGEQFPEHTRSFFL